MTKCQNCRKSQATTKAQDDDGNLIRLCDDCSNNWDESDNSTSESEEIVVEELSSSENDADHDDDDDVDIVDDDEISLSDSSTQASEAVVEEKPQKSIKKRSVPLDNNDHSDSISGDMDADDEVFIADEDPDKEKKEKAEAPPKVSVRQLYRYATKVDWLCIVVGSIGAIMQGVVLPGFSLVFGQVIDVLATDRIHDELVSVSVLFLYFGAVMLVGSWLRTTGWMLAGERQCDRIRRHYLRAVLRQEIGWFDKEGSNEIYSRLSGDLLVIREAISDKAGQAIQYIAQFVAGFALGFYEGWEMTLVILAICPILVAAAAFMMFMLASLTTAGQKAYARAGALALEAISNIRTVAAFGGEERSAKQYEIEIKSAKKSGIKKSFVNGFGFGLVMFTIFASYSLALWYGATLVVRDRENMETDNPYNGGRVLTILFSVIFGAFSLGQLAPSLSAISAGQGAAYVIFGTIERESKCNPLAPPENNDDNVQLTRKKSQDRSNDQIQSKPQGKTLKEIKGKLNFKKLCFAYPTRASVPVLKSMSLKVNPGETVAFVGASGCGKSTVLALLERFYEPESGSISVDGHPIESLNVGWWRSQLGYVGQQPVLFSGSIAENIAMGAHMSLSQSKQFDLHHLPVDQSEIERAAKAANAHEFISSFPHGYNTVIGAKGSKLSGGQKQRIAIARAFIRDPKILLLDEATSALDTASEAVVQDALDKAMEGRTTIVIAHRLATIRDADLVCVFDGGVIVQRGTFDDLANEKGGPFYKMVRQQGLIDEHGDVELRQSTGVTVDEDEESSTQDSDVPPPLPVSKAPVDEEDQEALDTSNERPSNDKPNVAKRASLRLKRTLSKGKDVSEVEEKPKKSKKKKSSKQEKKKSKRDKKREEAIAAGGRDALDALADIQAEEMEESESEELEEVDSPLKRVFKLNSPELCWYVIGCICAAGNGIKDPLFAIFFTDMITDFYGPNIKEEAAGYALIFLYIAIGTMLVTTGQMFCFGYGAEQLTQRVRNRTFRAILRQEVAFFDSKRNSANVLSARLSQDATELANLFGTPLGLIVQNLATAALGLGIAFVNSWKMTLVVLTTVPVLIIGQMVEFAAMKGLQASAQEDVAKATAVASESISEIRTVASLNAEELICSRYEKTLEKPHKLAVMRAWVMGVVTGFAQGLPFATYTLSFWYGGTLIIDGEITFNEMLMVFMSILFTAMGIGGALGMMPDTNKARAASENIFRLLDRKSLCDPTSNSGKPSIGAGEIQLKEIEFAYPSRRQTTVLRGFSATVSHGKVLALCGESGCGKSTSIGLIERYYEPNQGEILIDGELLETLNIARWRRRIGLVMQEPQLFTGTIKSNILYGVPDEEQDQITDDMIKKAAKDANAHAFIMKFPNGYDTDIGENGTQLSGGQKQRIAIARAIIRDPSVLLLDEATSALDGKSEKVVQDALDKAMSGRTTIVIAHRLSTIKDADQIAVVSKGRVVELGTHKKLLAQKGQYYKLVRRQTAV